MNKSCAAVLVPGCLLALSAFAGPRSQPEPGYVQRLFTDHETRERTLCSISANGWVQVRTYAKADDPVGNAEVRVQPLGRIELRGRDESLTELSNLNRLMTVVRAQVQANVESSWIRKETRLNQFPDAVSYSVATRATRGPGGFFLDGFVTLSPWNAATVSYSDHGTVKRLRSCEAAALVRAIDAICGAMDAGSEPWRLARSETPKLCD